MTETMTTTRIGQRCCVGTNCNRWLCMWGTMDRDIIMPMYVRTCATTTKATTRMMTKMFGIGSMTMLWMPSLGKTSFEMRTVDVVRILQNHPGHHRPTLPPTRVRQRKMFFHGFGAGCREDTVTTTIANDMRSSMDTVDPKAVPTYCSTSDDATFQNCTTMSIR